mgnify:CR=1 FL=1
MSTNKKGAPLIVQYYKRYIPTRDTQILYAFRLVSQI